MKNIVFVFFFFVSISVIAQKKNKYTPVLQKGWYLTVNPHSVLEPEQGAIGLGIGNRLSDHIEVWTEMNYLYRGFFQDGDNFKNLHGIRSITSFKYYYNNKHGFFVGAEFRLKSYSFNDKGTFINQQLNDTLYNYIYRPSHTLIGGGIFWGKRFKLTGNGKFEMEGNIGIGVKQRNIKNKKIPSGYSKFAYDYFYRSPIHDTDIEQALPYFPGIFRFIYHL